jgi:hypothetical protein
VASGIVPSIGTRRIGVNSLGRDGIDQTEDDIRSWE